MIVASRSRSRIPDRIRTRGYPRITPAPTRKTPKRDPHGLFARAALRQAETPESLRRAPRCVASLEALLPCPGRREIYLREIVCEYVRTLISVTLFGTLTAHLEEVPLSVSAYPSVPAA